MELLRRVFSKKETMTVDGLSEIEQVDRYGGVRTFYIYKGDVTVVANLYGRVDGPTAKLLKIGVEDAYKRMGLGEKLVSAFTDWAVENGAKHIVGEFVPSGTRKERIGSKRFYEKLGFTVRVDDNTIQTGEVYKAL